eukprot:TRINITY_DN20311_c0_g1_i1.p1 TRINITY_DN20311_c0_g1~~TRINITY_DN20311_c0_g1_i1.p1  ORF type:complete len:643 (+),score=191.16 TRINITY_DN20311_c0_g1_i1:98-1930(+)
MSAGSAPGCGAAAAPDGARAAEGAGGGTLEDLARHCDHSWVKQLACDPDTPKHAPNHTAREVFSGHYVMVRPRPLPDPYLVIHSPDMARELGLSEEEMHSERATRFLSGDTKQVRAFHDAGSWATPYALSIYGQPRDPSPDTFGTGNGYGDGRAISIAEVNLGPGRRWELQLKGAGGTPFRRTGDGRAVLRSSLREFLASEAMHAMGVSTTRALSLVASRTEKAQRPWYSPDAQQHRDPRVAMMRRMLGASGGDEPDMMHSEACATTCRTAASFCRVGHFELFFRRAARGSAEGLEQLKQLARHALFREYPNIDPEGTRPLQECVLAMAKEFSKRLAALAAGWLRVGYVQSNFNSDNCLVGGRTMDYGPFGFVERYDPAWGMWVGTGQHFAFMNQPQAAQMNYATWLRCLLPLVDDAGRAELQRLASDFEKDAQDACNEVWRRKMGLAAWEEPACTELWESLDRLLQRSAADWTIFWRQLADCALLPADTAPEALLAPLEPAWYQPLGKGELHGEWLQWLQRWRARVGADGAAAAALMRRTSPKYVPREWMLVEAYSALGFDGRRDDRSVARNLLRILTSPFDEHPDMAERYYRRQPDGAAAQGGTGFMT